MSYKCTIWKQKVLPDLSKPEPLVANLLYNLGKYSLFISVASVPQPVAHPQCDTTQSDNTCSVDFNKLGAQTCSVTLGKPKEFKEQAQIRFPLRIL